METQELQKKLSSGVIAFPITPFLSDGALDLAGLRGNLEVLLEHAITAVFAPGGTGEVFSLAPQEHREVVQVTLEAVGGKVPVVAGVGVNGRLGAEQATIATQAGADGILIFPPYYPDADPEGLADYYAEVAAATDRGLIVYSRDWFRPSAAWVDGLAERIPSLVGWKDGTGDIRRYQQIIRRVGDRLTWIGGAGDDQVPAYYSIGIRSFTSSIANVSPTLSLRLHEAASRGDTARLAALMDYYVIPLYEIRARRRGYEVSAMKELMRQLGRAAGPVRPPLPEVEPAEQAELKELLERWTPVL